MTWSDVYISTAAVGHGLHGCMNCNKQWSLTHWSGFKNAKYTNPWLKGTIDVQSANQACDHQSSNQTYAEELIWRYVNECNNKSSFHELTDCELQDKADEKNIPSVSEWNFSCYYTTWIDNIICFITPQNLGKTWFSETGGCTYCTVAYNIQYCMLHAMYHPQCCR